MTHLCDTDVTNRLYILYMYIYYCIIECHRYDAYQLAYMQVRYVASLVFEKAKDSNFILWARQSQVEITYSLRGKGFSRRLSN